MLEFIVLPGFLVETEVIGPDHQHGVRGSGYIQHGSASQDSISFEIVFLSC
jgi:hypothetical protein